MTCMRAWACAVVLSTISLAPMAAQSQPTSGSAVPLAPFRSVELRNGGKAILRYGPTQRVAFLKGSSDYTRLTVSSEGRLLIDKCKSKCARGYELEIEIVTPELARVSVAEGGTLQSRGSFPGQAAIAATVTNGGTVDIRSMPAASVTASVFSGGRIFVKPLTSIVANVAQGGIILYWGDPRVTQSIEHGGVIEKGTAADSDELGDVSDTVAPIPPVPPTPPRQRR